VSTEHLVATDFLATFVSRRVLPLQSRPHKMCHMSGRKDPSRTSSVKLEPAEVVRWINLVSNAKFAEDWEWGMRPYDRNIRPPLVS
jgi:hypothetical protein